MHMYTHINVNVQTYISVYMHIHPFRHAHNNMPDRPKCTIFFYTYRFYNMIDVMNIQMI